jgi:hypothetical protein
MGGSTRKCDQQHLGGQHDVQEGVVGAVVWANLPAGNLVDLRRLPGRLKAYSRLCCGVISRRSPAG